MPDEFPGGFVSVTEMMFGDEMDDDSASFVNDNGIRWLIGDGPDEYINIHGDIPENTC